MTQEELKIVENFITKTEPQELSFEESQAIVHMLYSIYIFTVLAPSVQREQELKRAREKTKKFWKKGEGK